MCGRKIKKRKYMEISSDDTVYKNDIDPGREILLIDILESDIGLPLNKLEEIVEEEYLEDLRMSLDKLQPRHKSILLDYYGGLSQKEVGKKYNTTQATICRIINREVKNLRVKFNSIELKEMRGK
jgi:RNA polymerase sigma factor (sigma-70 family)